MDFETSWGRPDLASEIDIAALRRYRNILAKLVVIGERMAITLILILGVIGILVMTSNLENIIFFDGTDLVCVYDGKTDQIYNTTKR